MDLICKGAIEILSLYTDTIPKNNYTKLQQALSNKKCLLLFGETSSKSDWITLLGGKSCEVEALLLYKYCKNVFEQHQKQPTQNNNINKHKPVSWKYIGENKGYEGKAMETYKTLKDAQHKANENNLCIGINEYQGKFALMPKGRQIVSAQGFKCYSKIIISNNDSDEIKTDLDEKKTDLENGNITKIITWKFVGRNRAYSGGAMKLIQDQMSYDNLEEAQKAANKLENCVGVNEYQE
eukprot:20025_1